MKHRNDIDGLRAIAVLPIVLFHAGLTRLGGGFVGVDIFFVISGFLITSIIVPEVYEKRFRLRDFYRRRIVRIFPALYVMLAATLLAGVILMLPRELDDLGRSAAATSTFVANFYFRRTADYFGGTAELKPLLHTWSLGVEEQFYIGFPLLLLLLRGLPRDRLRLVLMVLSVVSFALCWVASSRWPNSAFYLLPSRAWELGLGAVLALGGFPALHGRARSALSALGLAAIVVAVLVIRPGEAFPAPWGLLPCLGTALLIAYGEGTAAGRLLSLRPVRYIGLISFSLYLWHWPIITFYRLQTGLHLSLVEAAMLSAASVAAASLSYAWVEQPFLRRFRHGPSGRVILTGLGALTIAAAASFIVIVNGENWRTYPPDVQRVLAFAGYADTEEGRYQYRAGTCFHGNADRHDFDVAGCLPMRDDRPNVVVLGDSHAAQYWRALALRFSDDNVLQANASGCRPTLDTVGAERCTSLMDYVLGPLVDTGRLDGIVLGGRWQREEFDKLRRTVAYLRDRGIQVTVIGPTVEYEGEFPMLLARLMLVDNLSALQTLRVMERQQIDRDLGPLVRQWGATYFSAYEAECPDGSCRVFAPDGAPFHFDYGHMTMGAAQAVVDQMAKPVAP